MKEQNLSMSDLVRRGGDALTRWEIKKIKGIKVTVQRRHFPPYMTNGTANLSPPGKVQLSDIDHIPQPSLYPEPYLYQKPAIIDHSIPLKATQSTHSPDIVSLHLLYPCTQQLKSYCMSSQVQNCCCQGTEKVYVSDAE